MTVILTKVKGIKNFIFFFDTTQRLEQLFRIIRYMIRGGLNVDCLGLVQRLGDAATISQIYARHPA